jgi:hypothetical protein
MKSFGSTTLVDIYKESAEGTAEQQRQVELSAVLEKESAASDLSQTSVENAGNEEPALTDDQDLLNMTNPDVAIIPVPVHPVDHGKELVVYAQDVQPVENNKISLEQRLLSQRCDQVEAIEHHKALVQGDVDMMLQVLQSQ